MGSFGHLLFHSIRSREPRFLLPNVRTPRFQFIYFQSQSVSRLEELKVKADVPNTFSAVKGQIAQSREEYAENLDRLLEYQAERYFEDALDRYHAFDDSILPSSDDPQDWTSNPSLRATSVSSRVF
jgi:hypothetical protein